MAGAAGRRAMQQRRRHAAGCLGRNVRPVNGSPVGVRSRSTAEPDLERVRRPTLWQRRALRRVVKAAHKRPGEPLSSEDWAAYLPYAAQPSSRAWMGFLRSLPHNPRCEGCGAPFAGLGAPREAAGLPALAQEPGCVRDLRRARAAGRGNDGGGRHVRRSARLHGALGGCRSRGVSALLRRFYACAEEVLFPEALIDKLIGDEVMALYLALSTRSAAPPRTGGVRACGPDSIFSVVSLLPRPSCGRRHEPTCG